jgi:hypothetical protein
MQFPKAAAREAVRLTVILAIPDGNLDRRRHPDMFRHAHQTLSRIHGRRTIAKIKNPANFYNDGAFVNVVPRDRIELSTPGFSDLCSTN